MDMCEVMIANPGCGDTWGYNLLVIPTAEAATRGLIRVLLAHHVMQVTSSLAL